MINKLNAVYHGILRRCYNPNQKSYARYGGRGIKVCDEWLNSELVFEGTKHSKKGWLSFQKWALSNGYKEGMSIDRIDNNKGYSPENCRWVDRKVQSNNRNYCRLITYKGKTQNLKQWCEELGLNYKNMHKRLFKENWSIEKAFETKDNPLIKNITYKGETHSIAEWAKKLEINYGTLYSRIYKYNMPIEIAFSK